MRTVVGSIALSGFLALGSGCSSSGSSGSDGGGVASSKTIASLSDAEAGAFCTELAGIEGGYSHEKTLTCGDDAGATLTLTFSFDIGANQTECKAQFKLGLPPACAALTVGDVTSCVADTYAATCSSPDDPASCNKLITCASR